jgi:hypothetical protein
LLTLRMDTSVQLTLYSYRHLKVRFYVESVILSSCGQDDQIISCHSVFHPRDWGPCTQGPYGAGLNAARWDLKASMIEYAMGDPSAVWPDRFGVDIRSTPFLAGIFRRLVAVCLKHGAVVGRCVLQPVFVRTE